MAGKIVLSNVGTLGDLHPLISIALRFDLSTSALVNRPVLPLWIKPAFWRFNKHRLCQHRRMEPRSAHSSISTLVGDCQRSSAARKLPVTRDYFGGRYP
jgi:hypothetical protein